MEPRLVKTSKLLSLVLRHDPAAIGIELDPQGWVEVDVLLAAMAKHRRGIDRQTLEVVVATNEKKRFAISEDGRRIRASQGHSLAIDLGLEGVEPPQVLYHGTATRFLESILQSGLVAGERQHVHLSADVPTAHRVGARHGKPTILKIDCSAMRAAGLEFFLSANGVWLTAAVPPEFLRVQE